MQGIEIKKNRPKDFEKIYPLLKEFNSPFSHEDWQRIFSYRWDGAEDFVGYHLEHKNEVVGFYGVNFSLRNKNQQQYRFCNITSWIVKEQYRAATFLFIRKLQSLKNIIFTGLSPITESYQLLLKLDSFLMKKNYISFPRQPIYFIKKIKQIFINRQPY